MMMTPAVQIDNNNGDDNESDNEERNCILATILSFKNINNNINNNNINNNNKRRTVSIDSGDNDNDNEGNDNNDNNDNNEGVHIPDAVIKYGVLSYRPFYSLKVVLIRKSGCGDGDGDDDEGGEFITDDIHRKNRKKNYSLVYNTNRGYMRFRVT
jgi:hypothetical protein